VQSSFFLVVFHLVNAILCYQDIRQKEVSSFYFFVLIFSLIGIIFSLASSGSIIGMALFFLVCLGTSFCFKKTTIAPADVVYIFLCLFILEEAWPIFFIFLGVISLLTYALGVRDKDKKIPFFPAIYGSFVLTFYFF
jgi:lysylphosphatidylglycerol synthetase-like protein (DUF2156 family)